MNFKSILKFFEEHIEKMVFVLAVIIFLWLCFKWVIISPNHIKYDSRRFTPGAIDTFIYENFALALSNQLQRPPEPAPSYEPEYENFVTWLDEPLQNVKTDFWQPPPWPLDESVITAGRKFAVPQIGEVTDIAAEHIRTVAYVPKEDVTPQNPYDRARHEASDLDLVTIEAKFDVSKLYQTFYETFAGPTVPGEWQDPCLAQPVFAAVDLQRSQLLPNGRWSAWERVSRPQIDANKELFKPIENVENLPGGGVKLRILQYRPVEIARSLLQPDSYVIASPKEEWFPPHLHDKYEKIREDIERDERRKAAEEAEKEQNDVTRRASTRGTTRTRGGAGASTRGGSMFSQGGGLFGQRGGTGTGMQRGANITRGTNVRGRNTRGAGTQSPLRQPSDTASTTDVKKTKTIADIEKEYENLLITNYAKLSNLQEPLIFWAIDDTVQPNQTYRYRMRLGVFNPVAGTDNFTEEYKSYKDQLILWSNFSNKTDVLEIPRRLYFFPLAVQEDTKSVNVQISKYVLGYWHSSEFPTKPGEIIGGVAKPQPLTEEEKSKKVTLPKEINYNTGAMLVDVVPVNTWVGTSNLSQQLYNDLLYSYDSNDILRIPIKSRYWPQGLLTKYIDINNAQKEPREPLREWGAKSILRGKTPRKEKGERKTLESLLKEMMGQN